MSLKVLREFSGSSSSVQERTIVPVKDVQSSPFLTKGEIAVDSQSGFYYSDGTQWISPAEAGAASVNISDSSGPSGSASLIVDAQGPNLGLKKLTQGANIVLTQNGSDIMISGVAGSTSNLVDQGPGASLVTSGVGPVLGVRKIIGSGIVSVTENANDITITATAATITDSGPGASIISSGTGPTLGVRKIIGSGIVSVTENVNDITITATAALTTITDSGSGVSLITDGTGPVLGVRKLIAGLNVTLDDTLAPESIVISTNGSLPTTERLSVTTPNTVSNPSVSKNVSFLNFTQTTGATTGTLGNGLADGYQKTITYETGTTPYILTITNFLDVYGVKAPKTDTFFQAGKSVTYIWNAAKVAWTATGKIEPTSKTTVTVRLDPTDPTVAIATRSDGYVYPLKARNTNVVATNTLMTLLTQISTDLLATGGTVFFPAGKYYFQTWTSATPYLKILGEPGTKFIPGGNPSSKNPALSINAIYNHVEGIEFNVEVPWSNLLIDGVYGQAGGINCAYCDYSVFRNCSFNYMSAFSGSRMKGVTVEGCICTGTKGGMQSGREVYQCSYLNNYFRDAIDDCLHFFFNTQNCIIANNTVDCPISITRGGGGVGVHLTTKEAFPLCSDMVVTGNNFSNILNAALRAEGRVSSVSVTGNTFYNCRTVIIEEVQMYISNSMACLFASDWFCHGWTITGNTFNNITRPIAFFGYNSLISNNAYNNIQRENVIVRGNTVLDTDVLLGKNFVFEGDLASWNTYIKGPPRMVVNAGRGSISDPQSYMYPTGQILTYAVIKPPIVRGVQLVSFDIAVSHDGGPVPGTVLNIYYSDSDGIPVVIATTTFTVPETTDILTQPRTSIPIACRLIPYEFAVSITTPNGESVQVRHYNVSTATGGNNLPSEEGTGRELDYAVYGTDDIRNNTFSVGSLTADSDVGQVRIGPTGTGVQLIRNYSYTGNYPSVGVGAKVTVTLTATGVLAGDLVIFCPVTAVPTSLIVAETSVTATNQISLNFVNYTAIGYTAADPYSFNLITIRL